MKCPICHDNDHKRSRRGISERILSIVVPVRPFRCMNCYNRFYGLASPLFDLKRSISAVVISSFLMLIFSLFYISENPYQKKETTENTETKTSYPVIKQVNQNIQAPPAPQPFILAKYSFADKNDNNLKAQ